MLKKVIVIVLALSVLLCLAACGKEDDSEPAADPKTTPEYHFTDKVQERGILAAGGAANSVVDYVIPDDPEKYGELAGTRDGYVPEICRRIAEELGVELEYTEYKTVDELLNAVTEGDIDIAAGAFSITEERLALYEMTDRFDVVDEPGADVYLSTDPQPWQREEGKQEDSAAEPEPREMIQSEEELADARIAVVKGTAQAENTAIQYPDAEMHRLASNDEVLDALAAGQVDACVFTSFDDKFSEQIVQAIIDGTVAQCDYEVVDPNYTGYGLIFMKGNGELCKSVNEILSGLMESGWLLECYKTEEIEAVERGILSPENMRFKD